MRLRMIRVIVGNPLKALHDLNSPTSGAIGKFFKHLKVRAGYYIDAVHTLIHSFSTHCSAIIISLKLIKPGIMGRAGGCLFAPVYFSD